MIEEIKHQFLDKGFFLPTWPIETLVLGTFNPATGERTDYFYGRSRNKFWRAVELLTRKPVKSTQDNFDQKVTIMKCYGFGCTDIISSIAASKEVRGKIDKNYSDGILFTKKHVTPTFSTSIIKEYLLRNKPKRVLHTWGKRSNPKCSQQFVADMKSFCEKNNIDFISTCPSPSGRSNTSTSDLAKFYGHHLIDTNKTCP